MSKFLSGKTKTSKGKRTLGFIMAILMFFSLQVGSVLVVAESGMPQIEGLPSTLEAPKNLTAEVRRYEDGTTYFELHWVNTAGAQTINDLQNADAPLFYQIDYKVGDGKWNYETEGDLIHTNSMHDGDILLTSAAYSPIEQGSGDVVDIKANTYYLRVRYYYNYIDDFGEYKAYSPFSNIFTIGVQAFKGASAWAIPELNRAAEYGFITDKIKDKLNGPITREEFAEVAVKLYEKYTGKAAEYHDMNAFVDTQNPEIFKAYNLKIVNGTDAVKKLFSPKDLTNREQVAAMLYRAVKAIKPEADFSTAGSPTFSDNKLISGWALESVKFMSKNGFIKGSADKFDPKGTCTREMAVIIATRVYEQYSGISAK